MSKFGQDTMNYFVSGAESLEDRKLLSTGLVVQADVTEYFSACIVFRNWLYSMSVTICVLLLNLLIVVWTWCSSPNRQTSLRLNIWNVGIFVENVENKYSFTTTKTESHCQDRSLYGPAFLQPIMFRCFKVKLAKVHVPNPLLMQLFKCKQRCKICAQDHELLENSNNTIFSFLLIGIIQFQYSCNTIWVYLFLLNSTECRQHLTNV